MENGEKMLIEFIIDRIDGIYEDLNSSINELKRDFKEFTKEFDIRLKEQENYWFAQRKKSALLEKVLYYSLILIGVVLSLFGIKIGGFW
jgi:hypothetical protein